MSFFLGNAEIRQLVEYQIGFDFEIPRQLINTNLLHRKLLITPEGS